MHPFGSCCLSGAEWARQRKQDKMLCPGRMHSEIAAIVLDREVYLQIKTEVCKLGASPSSASNG
jgi:hypothetical protein